MSHGTCLKQSRVAVISEAGLQIRVFAMRITKPLALRRVTHTKPLWKCSHDWGKTHLAVPRGTMEHTAWAATAKGSKRRRYAGKMPLSCLQTCQQTEANFYLQHRGLHWQQQLLVKVQQPLQKVVGLIAAGPARSTCYDKQGNVGFNSS